MVSRKFISGVQCTGKLHIGNINRIINPLPIFYHTMSNKCPVSQEKNDYNFVTLE